MLRFFSPKKFLAKIGKTHIGHTGGDPGIMTFMTLDPETGYGYLIFTNKSDNDGDGYNQLVYTWKTLQDYITNIRSVNQDAQK